MWAADVRDNFVPQMSWVVGDGRGGGALLLRGWVRGWGLMGDDVFEI